MKTPPTDPTPDTTDGEPPPAAAAVTAPTSALASDDDRLANLQADNARLRDLLGAAGRLAEFGRFAAQQVHELRQPLFAIRGLGQLLLEKDRIDLDEVLDFARHIVDQSERLTALVNDLRQMSVPAPRHAKRRAEVDAILVRVMSLLDFRLRKGIRLRTYIAPNVPAVAAVPQALEQIVINLLANALDAVAGLPVAVIQVRARALPENPGLVEVAIADNGSGVAKAVRGRLFETFFTTKGDEQGTGLGLAVSRELARSTGGDLVLLDDPGPWDEPAVTVFSLTIPVLQEF